ncbi:MAG: hypothetical protein ACREN7_06735 [Candidatus Dormibacteria bacterium]
MPTAALLLALAPVASCASASAQSLPRAERTISHQSVYLGLDTGSLSQPRLVVTTDLDSITRQFPAPLATSIPARLHTPRRYLFVGLTLGRLTCRDNYLARVGYGPGALLQLVVRREEQPPRTACFQIVGPVRYQLLAIPLSQFPKRLLLAVQLRGSVGGPEMVVHLRLP